MKHLRRYCWKAGSCRFLSRIYSDILRTCIYENFSNLSFVELHALGWFCLACRFLYLPFLGFAGEKIVWLMSLCEQVIWRSLEGAWDIDFTLSLGPFFTVFDKYWFPFFWLKHLIFFSIFLILSLLGLGCLSPHRRIWSSTLSMYDWLLWPSLGAFSAIYKLVSALVILLIDSFFARFLD